MILLNEVAQKIQNILNGTDTEVSPTGTIVQTTNPTDYQFVVYTQGFHLDKVYDEDTGKNFIPVFVSSMGGQYNPVPSLKQATYTIPITLYYPVRFKDDFFAINDFLADAFVGTKLTYGTISGTAISNISVSQYGEIQEMDLDQFKEWVEEKYRRAINVHEPWMTLNFTLYLSTISSAFAFGNDAAITISIDGLKDESNNLITFNPKFVSASIQSQTQAITEQQLGENESQGFPFGVAYGSSLPIYYEDNAVCNHLIEQWFLGNSQTLRINFNLTIGTKTFSRYCFVESVNMQIVKGQPITITLSLSKAGDENA